MSNSEKHHHQQDEPHNAPKKSFQLFEYLVGAAREELAGSPVNAAGKNCYSAAQIREMVRSKELPAGDCLDHLTGCAKCFKEYRFALEVAKQTAAGEIKLSRLAVWRDWVTPHRAGLAWAFGFILAVGSLSAAVLFFARHRAPTSVPVEIAQNTIVENNNRSPLAPPENLPAQTAANKQKKTEKKTENSIVADTGNIKNPAKLNNAPAGATEDRRIESDKTSGNGQKVSGTPAKKAAIKSKESDTAYLNLRAEDEKFRKSGVAGAEESGVSSISARTRQLTVRISPIYHRKRVKFTLVDSFGNALQTGTARARNGDFELPNLRLQKFGSQTLRICLQLGTEIPECFPVKIK